MTDFLCWQPETIQWQDIAPDGTKYALLEGSRRSGLFTYAFFIPTGFWDYPHFHTQDARIFVAQGCLKLGYGRELNKEKARLFPAGSVLLVPADAEHFDGAEEDTLIFGVASGPWRTDYVNPERQSSAGTPL